MKIAMRTFTLKRQAVIASVFMTAALANPAWAQQDTEPGSARAGSEFSYFTKVEQQTIADVTKLMESYVENYSKADARGYASLFTYPTGGAAIGDKLLPSTPSFEAMVTGINEHFSHRKTPLRPVSTEISVHPINDVAAFARNRFNMEGRNGTQTMFVSVYLALKTPAGWKLYMQMNAKDSGMSFSHAGTSHRDWKWND